MPCAPAGERAITRLSRRALEARPVRIDIDLEDLVRQRQGGAEAGDESRLRGGFGPEAVIARRSGDLAGEGGDGVQELGEAVRSARDGHADPARLRPGRFVPVAAEALDGRGGNSFDHGRSLEPDHPGLKRLASTSAVNQALHFSRGEFCRAGEDRRPSLTRTA